LISKIDEFILQLLFIGCVVIDLKFGSKGAGTRVGEFN
jgi:hypothetical protein